MAPKLLLHFSYIVAQTQAHFPPTTTISKLSDVACEPQYIRYTRKINVLQMFIFICLMDINDIDIYIEQCDERFGLQQRVLPLNHFVDKIIFPVM